MHVNVRNCQINFEIACILAAMLYSLTFSLINFYCNFASADKQLEPLLQERVSETTASQYLVFFSKLLAVFLVFPV
jgi:hypothetical protein